MQISVSFCFLVIIGVMKKKPSMAGNNNEEDDSEWDSDSTIPSDGPSEHVLPPRTPEPGSEFEASTSGDEESDFSLGESKSKVCVPVCYGNVHNFLKLSRKANSM